METIYSGIIQRREKTGNKIRYRQRNGPSITKEEIVHAVSLAKCNKTPSPDEMTVEIIKLITMNTWMYWSTCTIQELFVANGLNSHLLLI